MARPAGPASHGRHLGTEFPSRAMALPCVSPTSPSGCLPALPLSSVKQERLKYIEMGEPDRTRDMDSICTQGAQVLGRTESSVSLLSPAG